MDALQQRAKGPQWPRSAAPPRRPPAPPLDLLPHAGLTREALAGLGPTEPQASFLIVPGSPPSPSTASSRVAAVCEALPQVWHDLFDAARAAQSDTLLDGLACAPALPAPTGARPPSDGEDPALGITTETVFSQFLSPQALVQVGGGGVSSRWR